jgi:hypothetical protein
MVSRAASEFPVRPEPSSRRFGWLSYLWQLRRNSLAVWPEGAYEEDFLVREILSHRRLWCMEADEHGFLPGSLIIRRRGQTPGVRGGACG